jgi:peptidylprolyl isomerase/peptidyl-prolyl cis-trans isomerase A (cyclophilin A)
MRAMLSLPIALALALSSPQDTPAKPETTPAPKKTASVAPKGDMYATFETSAGNIVIKLRPENTPKTVENFVSLAEGTKDWTDPKGAPAKKKPLYDGTLFHRVIPGFMIQGGDPLTKDQPSGSREAGGQPFGTGGPGYKFADELAGEVKPFEKPCQLAMANSGPDTNGSQFFITEGAGDQVPQLNPRPCPSPSGLCGYTRFGEGVCGCELVRKIAEAGNSQTRLKKVRITRGKAPACK